jgi:hypothetical protein
MCLKTKVAAAAILLCVFAICAQGGEDLPLHKKKLSERVLVVWVGDAMQMIKTVALATRKGLVVIETSLIRASYSRRTWFWTWAT